MSLVSIQGVPSNGYTSGSTLSGGGSHWGVLSRVGDRPTATILQAQFHFFDFCLVF